MGADADANADAEADGDAAARVVGVGMALRGVLGTARGATGLGTAMAGRGREDGDDERRANAEREPSAGATMAYIRRGSELGGE